MHTFSHAGLVAALTQLKNNLARSANPQTYLGACPEKAEEYLAALELIQKVLNDVINESGCPLSELEAIAMAAQFNEHTKLLNLIILGLKGTLNTPKYEKLSWSITPEGFLGFNQ